MKASAALSSEQGEEHEQLPQSPGERLMGKPPLKPGAQRSNGWALAGILVLIVLVLGSLGKCTSQRSTPVSAAQANFSGEIGDAVAAQPRQPPTPLSGRSIRQGAAHLRLAMADEGALGAQIYSQNCYDALSHDFSWAKLDACGAFDLLAARSMEGGDSTGLTQADYFQSETVAGRYLAAATSAGLAPADADQRLSQLHAQATRAATAARPTPRRETAPEPNPEPVANDTDAEANSIDETEDANVLDE